MPFVKAVPRMGKPRPGIRLEVEAVTAGVRIGGVGIVG